MKIGGVLIIIDKAHLAPVYYAVGGAIHIVDLLWIIRCLYMLMLLFFFK